jgi:hypothetical protein
VVAASTDRAVDAVEQRVGNFNEEIGLIMAALTSTATSSVFIQEQIVRSHE